MKKQIILRPLFLQMCALWVCLLLSWQGRAQCSLNITTDNSTTNCSSTCTGTLTALPTGMTLPLQYNWSDDTFDGAAFVDSVCAGTYTLTVTDALGCSATQNVTVIEGDNPLVVTAIVLENGCSSPPSLLLTTNSVGNFIYVWTGPNGFTSTVQNPIISTPGTYCVVVTTPEGCSATTCTQYTPSANLSITCSSTPASTAGGNDGSISVTINAVPGINTSYVIQLSSGQTLTGTTMNATFPNLNAGTYTVTVTSNTGCTGTCSTTITANSTGNCNFAVNGTTTRPTCFGASNGSVLLNISGDTISPITYQWSNGATTRNLTNVAAGTYFFQLVADNGKQAAGKLVIH